VTHVGKVRFYVDEFLLSCSLREICEVGGLRFELPEAVYISGFLLAMRHEYRIIVRG